MYKNKLKLFFISFILLSTIVMTIIIGYSLWIVGERKDIIPTYNFEDLFKNNIKLEEVYSAKEFDVTTISKVKFEIDWDEFNIYYLDSEKVELTTNNKHPFNAGKYYVKIESKTLHDVDGINLRAVYVELNISKATPSTNSEKNFLIKDSNNTYITTNSLISDLTITDDSGVMFHDESTNDSIINGSFEIIDDITLNVGNNSVKCLFTPTDTTNFNNLEFNIDINCFAMVDFYHNDNKFVDTLYVDTINNPKISKPISIPTSTKTGYEFDCWLYNDTPWNFEDDTVSSNMELYSSFKPIEYTITYILDGGNMDNNPSTYTIESNDITINNPIKSKHNFLGWSSNYFEGKSTEVIIKNGSIGNITLTANWERIYIFNIPAKDTTEYIYNGTKQTYTPIIDKDDLEFINITNNVQTNVGTYEVTVSLKDPSKSSWEDDSKDNLIYEFVIKPKNLTISNGTITITNGTVSNAGNVIEYSDDVIVSIPNININGIENVDKDKTTITYQYSLTDKGNNTYTAESTEKQYTFTEILSIGESNVAITPSCDDTNYTINETITTKFNVKCLRLYIKDTDVIEQSIDSGVRDWSTIKSNTLLTNVIFYRYLDKDIYSPTKENLVQMTKECLGMQDGQFKYGAPSVNNNLDNTIKITTNEGNDTSISTNANTYIVGSTYYAYFNVNNPYQIVNMNSGETSNINNYCIFKYKTVYNGSEYLTIEDALAEGTTKDLFTWGNVSNYGLTTFTSLRNIYNNKVIYDVSNNIYIPFTLNSSTTKDYDNTVYDSSGTTYSSAVFSCLLIPNNITLNITSKNLSACSAIANGAQGGTYATQRGIIYNNGIINVTNGNVYAYGYIKGEGQLNLYGTTKVYDILRTFNWCGGSAIINNDKIASGGLLNKNFTVVPFTEYTLHNISCTTKITSTVQYYAYFRTYMSGSVAGIDLSQNIDANVLLLGTTSDSSCMFRPSSTATSAGTANDTNYIIKKAMNALNSTTDLRLYSITGSNEVAGQRDILEVNGKYTDSSINIKVEISAFSGTLNTSTSLALPIAFMNINLKSGSSLELTYSDYMFLPGSSFKVESGSTCTIGKNVDINIADVSYTKYILNCKDKNDAAFIVDGTLIVKGNIGGLISTSYSNAKLNLNDGNTTSSYKIYYSSATVSGSLSAKGKLRISSANYNETYIVIGEYVSQKMNDTYVWSQTTARLEYVLNNGKGSVFSKEEHSVENGAFTIESFEDDVEKDDVEKLTRTHYEFAGWYKDELCTEEAFPYELFISSKVYAKWNPCTYDITYEYIYDNCSSQGEISNPNQEKYGTYTYGEVNSLSTNIKNGELVFGGWYLDQEHTQQITQLDTNITGNTTLYGLWYPAGTVTITINYEIVAENTEIKNILEQMDISLVKESEKVVSTNTNWNPATYGSTYNENTTFAYWFDSWYMDNSYTNKFDSNDFADKIKEFTAEGYEGKKEITLYCLIRNKNQVKYSDTDSIFTLENGNVYNNFSNFYLYPGQTCSIKLEGYANDTALEDIDFASVNLVERFGGFKLNNISSEIYPANNKFNINVPENYNGDITILPIRIKYYKVSITELSNATCVVTAANALNTSTGAIEEMTINSAGNYLFVKEGTSFTYIAKINEDLSTFNRQYTSKFTIEYYDKINTKNSISDSKEQKRNFSTNNYDYFDKNGTLITISIN